MKKKEHQPLLSDEMKHKKLGKKKMSHCSSGNRNVLKSKISRCFSINNIDTLPTTMVQFRNFCSISDGSFRASISKHILASALGKTLTIINKNNDTLNKCNILYNHLLCDLLFVLNIFLIYNFFLLPITKIPWNK